MKILKLTLLPLLIIMTLMAFIKPITKNIPQPINLSYIYPNPIADRFSGSYTIITGPVTYNHMHDTTITGKWYLGTSNAPNVTCVNCQRVKFINNLFGQTGYFGSGNDGIYLSQSSNITVRNCYFENLGSGILAIKDTSIKIDSCQAKNIQGPTTLGGDFAQMNRVMGPNCSVSYNRVENFGFRGHQEDMINLYACNGVPTSPIRVVGNKLRGGGPSTTGSGITVGDGPTDGSAKSSYELVFANIVINSGYVGIQCAGGNHIQIIQNYITSIATPYSHVGLAYGNFCSYPSNDITIAGNYVNWLAGLPSDQFGGSTSQRRDMSIHTPLPVGTSVPIGWNTNILGAIAVLRHIDASLLPGQLLTTANPIH